MKQTKEKGRGVRPESNALHPKEGAQERETSPGNADHPAKQESNPAATVPWRPNARECHKEEAVSR